MHNAGSAPFWQQLSAGLRFKIVAGNVLIMATALLILPYVSGYKAGLIEQQTSVMVQHAEVIAATLAEQLPENSADQAFAVAPLNALLQRLVLPSGTRARWFEPSGTLFADTQTLAPAIVDVQPLPSTPWQRLSAAFYRAWQQFHAAPYPLAPETIGLNGYDLPEVKSAMLGATGVQLRRNLQGTLILNVAVPVQRVKSVRGVLLLSDEGDTIARLVTREYMGVLLLTASAAVPLVVWSFYISFMVVRPLRLMARAAERLRTRSFGPSMRLSIPDFSRRADEVGHLSAALRDLLAMLAERINTAEAFAADVSHELKNPLTSLRAASENLPRMTDENRKQRLLGIIQHDVQRLERLINDIASVSRLDAQLWRESFEPLPLHTWLQHLREADASRRGAGVALQVTIQHEATVLAVASRLMQVLHNLIDNARSFSPQHGSVRITLSTQHNHAVLYVDDDGVGIPPQSLERIFERFYSDRPHGESFGQHSGLGLNICRQIMTAHHGSIVAQNRFNADGSIAGARFVLQLPLI